MPKRILQLTGMQSTKLGGIERYILEIVTQSAERGHTNFVQYESEPASTEYRKRLSESGAILVIEPGPRGVYSAARSIFKLVRETRPDVIHTHFVPGYYLPLVSIISRALGVRSKIAMVHTATISSALLKARIKYFGFDHVLGVSEAITTDLRRGGLSGDQVRTHYMGLIDAPRSSQADRARIRKLLGIPDGAVVYGNIAFDAPVKGVDLLLDAFTEVVAAHPLTHLIQLGVDSGDSDLAKKYSGVPNVHWLGIRDDARAYLSAVDVYVQPSRSEGLPLAIMEAMAMELPVIATRVGGNAEAVVHGETGYIIEPESASALAAGMSQMAFSLSSEDRRRLGAAGYDRFCNLFDGRNSVRDLCALYEL